MNIIHRLFESLNITSPLIEADSVAEHVPPTATYVTIGMVAVISNAKDYNGGEAGWESIGKIFRRRNRGQFHTLKNGSNLAKNCYLFLADDRLIARTVDREYFNIAVNELYAIDAHSDSDFLIFCRDGRGLLVMTQYPVEIPSSYNFETWQRSTTRIFGWDKVLEKYGVKTTF